MGMCLRESRLMARHLDTCHGIDTPPLTEELCCGVKTQCAANGDMQTVQFAVVRLSLTRVSPGVEVNEHLGT